MINILGLINFGFMVFMVVNFLSLRFFWEQSMSEFVVDLKRRLFLKGVTTGVGVLLFLVISRGISCLLKREYWKEAH
ncbi:MAG: hypothetical protein CL393_03960 [Acidiferrobacteraceae bacterium]|nr:hypothetical protein [Acidiferrobacteraceae bacterium]